MFLKQIIIATNYRSKLEDVTLGKGFYITWCGLSVKEIQNVRDQSNVIILCPVDENEMELKKIGLYMRDLCVDDEKIVYVYGSHAGVDSLLPYIPVLYVRRYEYATKNNFSVLMDDLALLEKDEKSSKPALTFMDDDIEYVSKLRLHLEPYFRIYVNHYDMKETGIMILRSNILIMSANKPLTLMQFSEIYGIIRTKMKQGDFHLYYLTDDLTERNRLNAFDTQKTIAFSRDMDPEQIADYLIKRFT